MSLNVTSAHVTGHRSHGSYGLLAVLQIEACSCNIQLMASVCIQDDKAASTSSNEEEQCPDPAVIKARMCSFHQQGRCIRGAMCTFAHDAAELQAFNPDRRYTHQVHLFRDAVCAMCVHITEGDQT